MRAPLRGHRAREHDLTPSVRVVTVPPVLRQLRYLTTGVLAKGAVIAMLATPFAGGCGPVEYINQVSFKAASALAAAKEAQADKLAPYEYTAAESYLHKAREEAGHAQYQDSIEFGHRAEELAQRARAIALTQMTQRPTASSEPLTGSEPTNPTKMDPGGEAASARRVSAPAAPAEHPSAPAAKSPAGE